MMTNDSVQLYIALFTFNIVIMIHYSTKDITNLTKFFQQATRRT